MAIPNVGQDPSMEVALATKMQLVLDQPMSDISTKLVNKDFEGDFFKIGISDPDETQYFYSTGASCTKLEYHYIYY